MTNSGLCDWCQTKGLDCQVAAWSQAKTCLVCKKCHTSCVQGGESTGQKRKQVTTIVILEELSAVEEEVMTIVPAQRKVLDKSFFKFELEEDDAAAQQSVLELLELLALVLGTGEMVGGAQGKDDSIRKMVKGKEKAKAKE